MAGKGDRPRPLSISRKEFDKRMDEIFGPKKVKVKSDEDNVEFPPLGESNKYGHTCSQCGEFNTHEDIGTYKMLNPECPNCGYNTERDHN